MASPSQALLLPGSDPWPAGLPRSPPCASPVLGASGSPSRKPQAQASQQSCRSETIALGPWGGFGSLVTPLKDKDWPLDGGSSRSWFLFKAPSSSGIKDGL